MSCLESYWDWHINSHLLISLKDTLTALEPLWILRITSIILFVSILGSLGFILKAAG